MVESCEGKDPVSGSLPGTPAKLVNGGTPAKERNGGVAGRESSTQSPPLTPSARSSEFFKLFFYIFRLFFYIHYFVLLISNVMLSFNGNNCLKLRL